MAFGLERQQEVNTAVEAGQLNATQVNVPKVMAPAYATTKGVGAGLRAVEEALKWGSAAMKKYTDRKIDEERTAGQVAAASGQTLEEVKAEGGGVFRQQGWKMMDLSQQASRMNSDLQQQITDNDYTMTPADFAAKMKKQAADMVSGLPEKQRDYLRQSLSKYMPKLAATHTREHLKYTKEQTVQKGVETLTTLSRDPSDYDAFLEHLNSPASPLANFGPVQRRNIAVATAITAMQQDNPVTDAFLERAGMYEGISTAQRSQLLAARRAMQGRKNAEYNEQEVIAVDGVMDSFRSGEIDQVTAMRQVQGIKAKYGKTFTNADAQVFDRIGDDQELADAQVVYEAGLTELDNHYAAGTLSNAEYMQQATQLLKTSGVGYTSSNIKSVGSHMRRMAEKQRAQNIELNLINNAAATGDFSELTPKQSQKALQSIEAAVMSGVMENATANGLDEQEAISRGQQMYYKRWSAIGVVDKKRSMLVTQLGRGDGVVNGKPTEAAVRALQVWRDMYTINPDLAMSHVKNPKAKGNLLRMLKFYDPSRPDSAAEAIQTAFTTKDEDISKIQLDDDVLDDAVDNALEAVEDTAAPSLWTALTSKNRTFLDWWHTDSDAVDELMGSQGSMVKSKLKEMTRLNVASGNYKDEETAAEASVRQLSGQMTIMHNIVFDTGPNRAPVMQQMFGAKASQYKDPDTPNYVMQNLIRNRWRSLAPAEYIKSHQATLDVMQGFEQYASKEEPDYGYGKRPDGTNKGRGYFGELETADGGVMTELTIGVNINGKETDIPAIVPTLTAPELQHLLEGGEVTKDIVQKAVDHARMRLGKGQPVYAMPEEDPDYEGDLSETPKFTLQQAPTGDGVYLRFLVSDRNDAYNPFSTNAEIDEGGQPTAPIYIPFEQLGQWQLGVDNLRRIRHDAMTSNLRKQGIIPSLNAL